MKIYTSLLPLLLLSASLTTCHDEPKKAAAPAQAAVANSQREVPATPPPVEPAVVENSATSKGYSDRGFDDAPGSNTAALAR